MIAGVRLQVVATGDLVEMLEWRPGRSSTVCRDDGTVFDLDPAVRVRIVPPGWSLEHPDDSGAVS